MESEDNEPKYGDPGYDEWWEKRWEADHNAWLASLSPIERKFLETKKEVQEKISLKLGEAHDALAEAEKLSEEFGIPFDSSISPLCQMFRPKSFDEKWSELSEEFIKGLELSEYSDWQYSAVCY